MKLIRYGEPGKEKPGVILNEKKYALTGFTEDYNEAFFETDGLKRLSNYVASHKDGLEELPGDIRLGAPFLRPSKIVCIGLNYADHAKESNLPLPAEPIIFFKSTTTIVGPNDDLIIPKNSLKTDWEVELAVVIGKKTSYVSEEEALNYVAGYCLINDYSERAFQMERGGQWVKGKSCDTFAPIGPFLATADEIKDVDNLRLWLTLNGKMMQDGNTSNLIFKVPFIVHYLSQFMTLLPGDVISTGTPAGVGLGQKPEPFYLKPGDVVELGIDGLGSSKQHVKEWR
ncbi:MAG: hydrolase family protein [Mucilaginibacter sp.]|nr:hydrolase family protein [Mucilaginibacter sp.]